MSTGENINANGALLSQDMVRMGFHRFPQTEIAEVSPPLWPQIQPLQIAEGYPFKAVENVTVPPGEVWFVDKNKNLLGRIINLAVTPPVAVTQDDSLEFTVEQENEKKTARQRDRREKDKLL